MQVDVGCLDRFVAEPQGDDRGVNTGVQQAHRGGVPEHVWGDVLAVQGRADACGGDRVFSESACHGISGQRFAAAGWEQWIGC